MITPYKLPEYKPYTTYPPPFERPLIKAAGISRDGLVARLSALMETLSDAITSARDSASAKVLINTGRDPNVQEALGGIWDEGTELPLIIYERLAGNANSKYQYMADVALSASRGVSGDYSLDAIDTFKMVYEETAQLLKFVGRDGLKNEEILPSCQVMVSALEQTMVYADAARTFLPVNDNYFKATKSAPAAAVATETQKEAHELLQKVNGAITASKRTLMEIARTASTFYDNKLSKLDTGFAPDVKVISSLLNDRATLIVDTTKTLFQGFAAGNSLRDTWTIKSAVSGVTPSDVSEQAYIDEPVGDITHGLNALGGIAQVDLSPFTDLNDIYIRRQGYTQEDAESIIGLLNQLGGTYTYIRAGIISVRAEHGFVEDLLQTINQMPSGSTLISGAMIALVGDKTVNDLQQEVESGVYSTGYKTVTELVDALNLLDVSGYTGTILRPGVIGLTGDDAIREAIISAINNSTSNKTLIGAGAVLITGDNTLDQQAVTWDGSINQLGSDLGDLTSDFGELSSTVSTNTEDIAGHTEILSYWSLSGTTLIDGAKIMTGTVILDTLLSGMDAVKIDTISVAAGGGTDTIDIGSSLRIREIRMVSTGNAFYIWPTNASYFQYKVSVSVNNTDWAWIRGTATTWATQTRVRWTDADTVVHDQPILFPLAGSHGKYIKYTFDGFYTAADVLIGGEDLVGTAVVYGAAAYIDGGHIYAKSIAIGNLNDDLQQTLGSVGEGVSTYYSATEPVTPNIGDLWYDTINTLLKRWSGSVWELAQGAGFGNSTYVQDDEPTEGMVSGDTWIDTDDGNSFHIYDASSSPAHWVDYTDAGASRARQSIDANGILTGTWKPLATDAVPDNFAGLFANANALGYVVNPAGASPVVWKTYMDNVGNFFLRGADIGGNPAYALSWDGTDLNVVGSITVTNPDGFAPLNASRNFNSEPTTPYSLNDTWTDGARVWKCTTARATGTFVATDWTITSSRNFVSQPQTSDAYNIGDTWTDTNKVWKCITAKAAGAVFNAADWTSSADTTGTELQAGVTITGGGITLNTAAIVKSGKTSWADTTAGFMLGSDGGVPKFMIGDATSYLSWSGTALSIKGTLTADSGNIGGFTVTKGPPASLTAGTGTTAVGMVPSTYPFYAGGSNPATAPFNVSNTGTVSVSNLIVYGGSISWGAVAGTGKPQDNATYGSPWNLVTGTGKPADNATYGADWSTTLWGKPADSTLTNPSYLGTSQINATDIYSPRIHGGTIDIGSGNSIFKSDANGIYLGNANFGNAPFRVTMAGALTATNATITGNITATSGSFSGAVYASSGSFTGTITSSSTIAAGIGITSPQIYLTSGSGSIHMGSAGQIYQYGTGIRIYADNGVEIKSTGGNPCIISSADLQITGGSCSALSFKVGGSATTYPNIQSGSAPSQDQVTSEPLGSIRMGNGGSLWIVVYYYDAYSGIVYNRWDRVWTYNHHA